MQSGEAMAQYFVRTAQSALRNAAAAATVADSSSSSSSSATADAANAPSQAQAQALASSPSASSASASAIGTGADLVPPSGLATSTSSGASTVADSRDLRSTHSTHSTVMTTAAPPATSLAPLPATGGQQPPQIQTRPQLQAQSQSQSLPQQQQHKRVYQACIPCRRRKVRCDLGSVDNPHDPPCVRCRRESKDCYFSATRRKRKTDDEPQFAEEDEYVARNRRKRLHADSPPLDRRLFSEVPLTPGGSRGRSQPLKRPRRDSFATGDDDDEYGFDNDYDDALPDASTGPGAKSGTRAGASSRDHPSTSRGFDDATDEPIDAPLENFEAQSVMRREVYGPHDALDLLYKAATDSPHNKHEDAGPGASVRGHRTGASQSVSFNVPPPDRGDGRAADLRGAGDRRYGGDQPLRQGERNGPAMARASGKAGMMPGPALGGATNNHDDGVDLGQHPAQHHRQHHQRDQQRHNDQQPIDPLLEPKRDPTSEPGYAEALKAWARFRFVRAGWFTAQEAIDYIDYYYEYLSPLTPISPPTFSNAAAHLTLLTEEPILTVTLLTIASRYRQLPGTGGHCRSHAIHEQLWTYLRGMIERVVWGQEAFGGGFCGSGGGGGGGGGLASQGAGLGAGDDNQTSSTAPWRGLRKGSLRTLGTIESLMILTEWHPRALHFPPAEAIDELLLPAQIGGGGVYGDFQDGNGDGQQRPVPGGLPGHSAPGPGPGPSAAGVGGRRIESWLEPAWRSDRMCWMLLSTAMGLGYELGVFDDVEELLAAGAITRPEYEEETYRLRAYRIKRLLLIYLTQLAGRLGWTNMVPESLRKTDPAVAGSSSSRRRPTSVEGATPGTSLSSASAGMANTFNYIPDLELDDQIIHCWAGISNAMHVGNEKLFRSRKHTTDIIQSGKYIALLREFQPMLREWWREFERYRLPPYIRHVLTIEYEYVRIYINSLSLQAVVERCTSNAGNATTSSAISGAGGSRSSTSANSTASSSNGASNGASNRAGSRTGNSVGDGLDGITASANQQHQQQQHQQQLSPQTQNYFGKLPLGRVGGFGLADQEYVKEVVDGSRNLLRTVVDGLLPNDYLKHAPVRTYFRIISGAMFLLKTFALGAPRSDVELSIGLMDRTVDALRNCVVDDVHLGKRFADLLETLTSRLRNRFIHAPAPVPATAIAPGPVDASACALVPSAVTAQATAQATAPAPAPAPTMAARTVDSAGAPQASSPSSPSSHHHQSHPHGHLHMARHTHDGHTHSDDDGNDVSGPGGANGQGHSHVSYGPGPLDHGPAWPRAGTERSSTPANISATPFDATAGNFPYPGGPASIFGPSTPAPSTGLENSHHGLSDNMFGDPSDWNNSGGEMWYLPTGPALFQNMGDSAVAMTAEGVNVGGIDLLEYMAMDQFPAADGHGF